MIFETITGEIECGDWFSSPEGNLSLQLTVDPLRPRALPECSFLGPDQGECCV